jgi:hypothetical protein
MIHVPPIELDEPAWQEWKQRADKACEALIQEVTKGGKSEIVEALYKEQKKALLGLFNGKCAYCEVRLTGNQPGDVEHYRPKKDVTDEDLKPVFDQDKRRHPGYYWLAYHWLNLLPSCIECNRPSTGPDGKPRGKRNRFPVRGFRAFSPRDEDKEEPLLLNPWQDHPEEHLRFDDEMGVLGSITEEGRKTIEVLDLNREGLREARKEALGGVKGLLTRLTAAMIEGNLALVELLTRDLEEYKAGGKPFSAVARAHVDETRKKLARI